MGRARSWALVAAAVLTLAGCEMSQVDPDAEVRVAGTVVDGGAVPLEDRTVVLLTEPTVSDVAFGLPFGLGSLGLACLVDDPPPPCDTRRRVETDDQGRFAFTLTGRETQGAFGEAARMTVSAAGAAQDDEFRGPATTGAFVVRSEQVGLEPLPLVRTRLFFEVVDGQVQVQWAWPTGPPMRGTPGQPELVFEVGDQPVWVAPADATGVDLRVLEDTRGALSVGEQRRADGTIDDLTYRSETVGYASGAGAPRSRGAVCFPAGDPTQRLAPCPLTDGDLSTPGDLCVPDGTCPEAFEYDIDLTEPVAIELVVVRGCDSECPVHWSPDGEGWLPFGVARSPYATFTQAVTARYVRVGTDLNAPAEVSIWDGSAASQVLERTAPDRPAVGTGGDGSSGDGAGGGAPTWLLALGGVLVLAAVLGIGVAIGRGRRTEP